MKVKLYRRVGQRLRYYKLSINQNLFGDYLLLREYGSILHSHSFEKINILKTKIEAYRLLQYLLVNKIKRGYMLQQKETVLKFSVERNKTKYAA